MVDILNPIKKSKFVTENPIPENPPVYNLISPPVQNSNSNVGYSPTPPQVKFGDYTMNLRKLMDEMKQKEAITGVGYEPQVTEAIAGTALGIGAKAASEAVFARKEDIWKTRQIEIAEKQLEEQKKAGDGGTVICTELYSQGLLSEGIYQLDSRYGEIADIEVLQGYRLLAYPLVRKMRDSKLVTKIVSLFAIPTAYEIAHRVNPSIRGTIIGKVILFIGTPICKRFYRITRRLKWQIS